MDLFLGKLQLPPEPLFGFREGIEVPVDALDVRGAFPRELVYARLGSPRGRGEFGCVDAFRGGND